MEDKRLEYLKRQYKFEVWRGFNALGENLFIWNYFLSGNEFPEWQLHTNRPLSVPGWPHLIQSVWKHSEDDSETILRLDIYQCSSREKSHELLINVLGQFHLPTINRKETAEIGDVAFVSSNDAGIVFARANLVFVALNAGRRVKPIVGEVSKYDQAIYSKPKYVRKVETAPEIRRFQFPTKELQIGESIPLELEVVDPLRRDKVLWPEGEYSVQSESSVYLKFFSSLSGEVSMERNRLVYKPTDAGLQKVSVYAINAAQNVHRRVYQFDVIQ